MANSPGNLARNLTDLINKEIISKTELSRKSGISRTNLDHYIKETAIPRLDVIDKLASVLDIRPTQLIADVDRPTSPETTDLIINEIYECILKLSKTQREIVLDLAKSMILKPGNGTDTDEVYIKKAVTLINLMSEVGKETAVEALEMALKMDLRYGGLKNQ